MSFPPREGRKLHQISNHSRKIKKPPLPPKTPVVKYENEPEIITVKTPVDFTYIVQLLTGDPNRPPPKYPCNCDHHDPQPPNDRPLGILSPTPTSLPSLVTPSPSSDPEFNIYDYLEEWAEAPALSLYPVVNPPPSPPPTEPNFRVPPSPFRALNTEIPPSFNTPLLPLFYSPNQYPPNN